MRLSITHRTEYLYERSVHHSIQELRLTPQDSNSQLLESWKIYAPSKLIESIDAFGNTSHVFVLDANYQTMQIEAKGVVLTKNQSLYTDAKLAVSPHYLLQQTPLTQASPELINDFTSYQKMEINLDLILKLALDIQEQVSYQKGATNASTSAADAWEIKKGVCQDHTHIMLSICRHLHIPARYVSGYFFDELSSDLASHAWVDVCLDINQGIWHSIDITNACQSDERHVRIAIGRDYAHVAPVKGIRSGGGIETLNTHVTIERC
jgi:transglutaminase-like putative cysteine protease